MSHETLTLAAYVADLRYADLPPAVPLRAKHLTIDMTAKTAPGLSLIDFMAAETDPTALVGKVTIDAVAK